MSRETLVKALFKQIPRLVEEKIKLSVEHECLRIGKQKINVLQMSHLRPKRSVKATKNLIEHRGEHYLSIKIHIASNFNAWCMKEVAQLQHFCAKQRRNWRPKADTVN